ncbi:hypothetical protein [Nonomuraea sp. NPDC049784]|uniref:hypothetical protein n=1 Tax=Nonomuraea sp. NPDC049784 TaxID=3154361 RepID=UPI00340EB46D
MPAHVIEEPLAVEFTFPDGTRWTGRLDGLPNPRLAADLAMGLAQCTHPHGGIGAKGTAVRYCCALRATVRQLSAAGFDGSAEDLRRHHLAQLWLAMSRDQERSGRMMFKAFNAVTGRLDEEVRGFLQGRLFQVWARSTPLQPYSDAEWARLIECGEALVAKARGRQRHVLELAKSGGDPRGGDRRAGVVAEDLAHLLMGQGPLLRDDLAAYLGRPASWVTDTGTSARLAELRESLFPSKDIVFAFKVLFGAYSGIVPDGIAALGVGDIDWAGDGAILLDYVKRRTGPESVRLPKGAVRLLERWLDHSAPARLFAGDELRNELWLVTVGAGTGAGQLIRRMGRKAGYSGAWVSRHGLKADDGSAFPLHSARIRTTFHAILARRGWSGRVTIDPNHSPAVEGDHYLSASTPAQREAVETIIAEAQADVLRKAHPPAVISDEQLSEVVTALPATIDSLGLDGTALAELVGGERDVFTAACADQLASPFAPAGTPCPARPWVCLMCPLALFMPRHAPNLLRLKAFFARQSAQMPVAQFMRVFGPYAQRLDREILPNFNERTLAAAARHVADDDHELPLRPEETT